MTQHEVFEKISRRELEFPYDMDSEAVDLIHRLLCIDHNQRLGVGAPGEENSFEALKSHRFFAGINFSLLKETAPPLPTDRFK